jgi:sugar diacid utilization regulator
VIEAFSDIASALREAIPRDELFRLATRKMCELVGVTRGGAFLRDESTNLYRGFVGHDGVAGWHRDAHVKRLVSGMEADAFTREIVETKRPVVVNDAMRDPRVIRSVMRTWNVRSMIGVPIVLRSEVIGLFYLDSEDKSKRFDELDKELTSALATLAAVAISQAALLDELVVSRDTTARQNRALRRAAAIDDRLTSLVIRGATLGEIATTVTELTGKPCAILNAGNELLCAAASEGDMGGALDADQARLEEVRRVASSVGNDRPQKLGPINRAGINSRLLVAPVTVRDQRWATLVIAESGGQLTDFDLLISRRIASIIALEMSAEKRASATQWNAREALASELIRGSGDIDEVIRRAKHLGVPIEAPHVVALISFREGEEWSVPHSRGIAQAISDRLPGQSVLVTWMPDGAVAIVELPAAGTALTGIGQVKNVLLDGSAEAPGELSLIAGLSTVCTHASAYPRGYEEAQQVVACLDNHSPPARGKVLAADDLGAGRLLLSGTSSSEAKRFVEETFGPLLDGSVGSGDLILTLVTFFDTGRNVRATAGELGMHENTIRYRMRRIEELTGLDVAADASAQLRVQVALVALDLNGYLGLNPKTSDPVPANGRRSPS